MSIKLEKNSQDGLLIIMIKHKKRLLQNIQKLIGKSNNLPNRMQNIHILKLISKAKANKSAENKVCRDHLIQQDVKLQTIQLENLGGI